MPSPGEVSVGNNNTRLISSAPIFDPEFGIQNVDTYEGPEEGIKQKLLEHANAGFRSRTFPYAGPIWRAEFQTVPSQAQTGAEEITDQWELDTDFIQENIYHSPRVQSLAGGEDTLSIWKARIENELKNETPKTPTQYAAQGVSNEELAIYILRLRGAQASEVRRIILRRVRTIAITNGNRVTPDAIERIYSTPALIKSIGIPGGIAARLPATPSTAPTYTAWSWKARRDTSVFIPRAGKVQEVKDWVFAAWSTVLYVLTV